ncbi:MAG TPA: hypothetical protein DD405_07750 [Desulfobacteraceae bacterium]|nr:hypothetical protein [Desulfobacteraceae bacterium]
MKRGHSPTQRDVRSANLSRLTRGTIFLDEIGELPLLLQVKILRFLQKSTIERLGGTKTITLNVRIIAATNVNLENAVKQGTFREDLFYRLNVIPLRIPNLNQRPEDILLLAHHFLLKEAQNLHRGKTAFSSAAIASLAGQCPRTPKSYTQGTGHHCGQNYPSI